MIRRRGERPQGGEDSSSDDEEDAFEVLNAKSKRPRIMEPPPQPPVTTTKEDNVSATTSLDHKSSHDIPTTKSTTTTTQQQQQQQWLPMSITSSMKRHHKPSDDRKAKMDALLQELEMEKTNIRKEVYRFEPEKKGSFVDPSEEHLTTNMFVGNLAPTITEEALKDLFSQFGDLYSVKIMWPRTPMERNRNRNTGFVCFMNRRDAEEAMDACNDRDPFNVGRLITLRWGKSVLTKHRRSGERNRHRTNNPQYGNDDHNDDNDHDDNDHDDNGYHHDKDPNEISISSPPSKDRRSASFSSSHGMESIPMTGRQLELAKRNRRQGGGGTEPGAKLTLDDRRQFDWLVREQLSTISKGAIYAAMAFCFEKSSAAREISQLLKQALMEDGPTITADMRIARLYLLSDILLNSQQPGVKNGFIYRDEVEKMAPEIFTSLGLHGGGTAGRITMSKLRSAVSDVLGAWTEWSLYNPVFMDELDARFEGKEIKVQEDEKKNLEENSDQTNQNDDGTDPVQEDTNEAVVILQPRSGWTEVVDDDPEQETTHSNPTSAQENVNSNKEVIRTDTLDTNQTTDAAVKGNVNDMEVREAGDDLDGEAIEDEDIDGVPLDDDDEIAPEEKTTADTSNDADDVDGEALDDDDLDGEVYEEEEELE